MNSSLKETDREKGRKKEERVEQQSKILKKYFFTFNISNFKWKTVKKVT